MTARSAIKLRNCSEKTAGMKKQQWRLWQQSSPWMWGFSGIGFALICGLVFLWNLGAVGLVDETEPLFAEAARQMTVTGDWITPYFNQETRFDKPPLVYWLMAVGYQTLGVNEWAVRLPSAVAAIILTIACFLTLRSFGILPGSPASQSQPFWLSAWIGMALAAFNLETIVWARQGVSDMLLSGCMGTGLLCFFWGYAASEKSSPPPRFIPHKGYLLFYILTALAVLTKGPVGIVLPGLILLTFLLYTQQLKAVIQEMNLLLGSLIFFAITLPWFVLVTLENGQEYIDSFFGYHNVERFTQVVNGHSAPWYFYFLVVLIGFLPWSVYLPVSIHRLQFWNRSFWLEKSRSAQLGLFAFFWFANIFVFFSISVTKLPSYVLPLMPAAAILVALFWSDWLTSDKPKKKGIFWSLILNIILLVTVAIFCFYSPRLISSDPAIVNLPELVANSNLPEIGGLIWLVTALIVAFILITKQQKGWILGINMIGFIAFFIFVINPALFFMDAARQLPLRQLSLQIPQVQQPNEEIVMIGFKKPSIVFYSQRPVQYFSVRNFLKPYNEPINYLKNSVLNSPKSLNAIVISRPKDLSKIGLKLQDYQVLNQQGSYLLIRIDKRMILNRVLNLDPSSG
jgi:4-amino-4-deoxy-L-arabinose transferase-like glycosyltransferase